MKTVIVDFSPSLHGHFLEYMISRYIFDVPAVSNLFEGSGASDIIEKDTTYRNATPVHCDHYSELNIDYPSSTKQIIYIKHNEDYDYVSLVNSFYRVFDRTNNENNSLEDILKFHMVNLQATSVQDMRNRLYTKLLKRHFRELYSKKETNLPVYEFDYGSFFVLHKFIASLRNIADVLSKKLIFNSELVNDWNQFIKVNQGYQYLNIAEQLITSIINNKEETIDDNVFIHAYINCQLSHAFPIYTGAIFDDEKYPTNTKEIYNLINEITK